MSRKSLKERVCKGVFLLDGAMGTQLFERGAEVGGCNDYLNIERPRIVADVHLAYAEAGSDAVLTNTFGANHYCLKRHGLEAKVREINRRGTLIAREAVGEDKYVLGDIGSCGDFLEPVGNVKEDELRQAFVEQAQGLLEGGVDGFIIETMTALDELKVALKAVKSVGGELPVFASMSFGRAGDRFKTMMGVDLSDALEAMCELGADGVGFNCGTLSLGEYVRLAGECVRIVKELGGGVQVYAEPNAGMPELEDGRAVYKVTAAEFAEAAEKIFDAGVTIIGGCCGTSPEYIRVVAERLKR